MKKLLLVSLFAVPLVGCASSVDEAPAVKGEPPPVVSGTRPNAPEHVRGGAEGK